MGIFDLFRFPASDDIIDLDVIQSDLVDIPISEAEATETAYYDALSMAAKAQDNDKPLGKMVY